MKSLLLASALAVAVSASAQAASMRVNEANYFIISGDIVDGDSERFAAATAGLEKGTTIFLSSAGGDTIDALVIGQQIRKRQFTTAVWKGNTCASACALIWLAGTTRFVHPNARIGFHASYNAQTGQESGVGNAIVGAYMRDLEYSYAAIIFATKAAPSDAQWLNSDNAQKVGITSRVFTK